MARTEEAELFFSAVYAAVQEVPRGKVTSYGHIATLIGRPECPRQVGICLKHLPNTEDQPDCELNNETVPWQRIINAKGIISPRGHPLGATRQAEVLRSEGVEVDRGDLGEFMIDFSRHGWFPDVLPSEENDSFE